MSIATKKLHEHYIKLWIVMQTCSINTVGTDIKMSLRPLSFKVGTVPSQGFSWTQQCLSTHWKQDYLDVAGVFPRFVADSLH